MLQQRPLNGIASHSHSIKSEPDSPPHISIMESVSNATGNHSVIAGGVGGVVPSATPVNPAQLNVNVANLRPTSAPLHCISVTSPAPQNNSLSPMYNNSNSCSPGPQVMHAPQQQQQQQQQQQCKSPAAAMAEQLVPPVMNSLPLQQQQQQLTTTELSSPKRQRIGESWAGTN